MNGRRKVLSVVALIGAAIFALPSIGGSQPAPPPTPYSFVMSTTNTTSPWFPLSNGLGTCSVVVDNVPSGLTIIPQVTSDTLPNQNPAVVTASNVGSGAITASGTSVGNVSATGLTGFRLVSSGTYTGTASMRFFCSNASSSGSSGGGSSNVTVINPSSAPVPVAPPTGTYAVSIATTVPVLVQNTPAPYIPVALNSAATPAPLNLDASGNLLANVAAGTIAITNPEPTASAGSTQSPVLNSLKKSNGVLTTTALGASAVYTGSWIDTTTDNTTFLNLETYSAVGGGTLVVQESNDTTGFASLPIQLASTAISAASNTRTIYSVTARYWRVVYTNGATPQTTFEIAYTSQGTPAGYPICDNTTLSSCAGVGGNSTDNVSSGGNSLSVSAVLRAQNTGGGLDKVRKDAKAAGPLWVDGGGGSTNVVCAAAANCSVATGNARLASILITTVGTTGTITCYDNTAASGTVIGGVSAANGALLFSNFVFDRVASTGIYCVSATSGPAFTVSYY